MVKQAFCQKEKGLTSCLRTQFSLDREKSGLNITAYALLQLFCKERFRVCSAWLRASVGVFYAGTEVGRRCCCYFVVPMGIFPTWNSGRFPQGQPAATGSRCPTLINYTSYPTILSVKSACWVFLCFHSTANSDLEFFLIVVKYFLLLHFINPLREIRAALPR